MSEQELAQGFGFDLKVRVRRRVRNAVASGKISKPSSCSLCGRLAERRMMHGHHSDYSKPLDVQWICGWCHSSLHSPRGEKHPCVKLTEKAVLEMRGKRANGEPLADIAKAFNVSVPTACQVTNGSTWKHMTAVPVLAEPIATSAEQLTRTETESGEARESTTDNRVKSGVSTLPDGTDSRGGSQQSPVHAPAKAVTGARSVLRGAGRANSSKAESLSGLAAQNSLGGDELHRDPFFSSKHKLKEIRRWRKRSLPLWSDTF